MGYAKEFNAEDYNVPSIFLKNVDWEDYSWHNDVCPRWENRKIGLAVWVDNIDPDKREYDDWKMYTVVGLIHIHKDECGLCDDILYDTEDQQALLDWLTLYETKMHVESALTCIQNHNKVLSEDINDSLHSLYSMLEERITIC